MNDAQMKKMYTKLYTDSFNNPKMKENFVSTPKSDGKKELSEIDICYSHQYDSWFIKSFWGTKKAYRYNVKKKYMDLWLEFMERISETDDELYD